MYVNAVEVELHIAIVVFLSQTHIFMHFLTIVLEIVFGTEATKFPIDHQYLICTTQ